MRPYPIQFILFFGVLCLSSTLHAQVPGYQGKRFSAEIGLGAIGLYNSDFSLNIGPQVRAEYAIGRKSSIGFTFESQPSIINDNFLAAGNGNEYYYIAKGTISSFGLQYIKYWSNTGWSLAPMGMYTGYTLFWSSISASPTALDPSSTPPLNDTYKASAISIGFNWGKRLIIQDKYSFNFGTSLYIPVSKSQPSSASNNQILYFEGIRKTPFDVRLYLLVGGIF